MKRFLLGSCLGAGRAVTALCYAVSRIMTAHDKAAVEQVLATRPDVARTAQLFQRGHWGTS